MTAAIAGRIASGRAYRKHVALEGEYREITSPDEFAALIEDVIANPDATKVLPHGRHASWQFRSRTVVIVNPRHPDGGTAFRPSAGRAYFDRLRSEE